MAKSNLVLVAKLVGDEYDVPDPLNPGQSVKKVPYTTIGRVIMHGEGKAGYTLYLDVMPNAEMRNNKLVPERILLFPPFEKKEQAPASETPSAVVDQPQI